MEISAFFYITSLSNTNADKFQLLPLVTGMAQDFVGSNNINLLEPRGQFGTRMAGGKDAASPRYIFTCLSPISRLLFPDVDDALLHHLEDDGVLIEPKFYCPIIPLLLVNGSQGIGTGWSTFIPQHNARDVLEHIRAKLDGAETLPIIKPWARGFAGKIEMKEDRSGYRSIGRAAVSFFNQDVSHAYRTRLTFTSLFCNTEPTANDTIFSNHI